MSLSAESPLILASSSRYRAELLARLQVPLACKGADVDESPRPAERPATLARRLAAAKARAVGAQLPSHWVLGSDQTADCGGVLLGKPGTEAAAAAQLRLCSGREVIFHTAVALLAPDGRRLWQAQVPTTVHFRRLRVAEIQRYLQQEPALDCAGSFKAEGLGISLFTAIDSRDPTALIGLPLIATCRLLRHAGWSAP